MSASPITTGGSVLHATSRPHRGAASPGRRVTRVLLTCSLAPGAGGVQVVFDDLARWLEWSGRDVLLLREAPARHVRPLQRLTASGRKVAYCPMPARVRNSVLASICALAAYAPITAFFLVRLMRRERIDAINCHYLAPQFVHVAFAARLAGVPLVLSVHGADVDSYAVSDWMTRLLMRLVVSSADRVVACSAALAKETARVFPTHSHKMSWVHNALDLTRYGKQNTPAVFPRPYLLCVCRHVAKKGVDTLLNAFRIVKDEIAGLSLVLVGDGPLLTEHKAVAMRLGVDDKVAFIGEVPVAQVAPFFAGCEVFVLPSRAEPFGIVVLEAAYYSRPIVCTRVGGLPEIVTDGVDALMVEPDDPKSMAARILTLLRDPALAARLGEQAHRTLHERFLWKERIEDYIGIYEGRPGPVFDTAHATCTDFQPASEGASSYPDR